MSEALAALHFLRPAWLLALPVLALAAWQLLRQRRERNAWSAVVEPGLQPYVLIGGGAAPRRQDLLPASLGASLLAVLALAGPTWERVPVPALRSGEALVVALDLSRSMDAADLAPSRLGRAKLKLLALLERRASGQTALVVFSAHAFTVTPLTTDTRTIAALVTSLTTDLMPSRGSYPEVGMQKAAQLLRQTGIPGGEILLISDADPAAQALELARELRAEGIVTHVLAIGTEAGAPIAEAGGGFLTNSRGEVVLPRLDARRLERLAAAGGGRFATVTPDDADLERLLGSQAPGGAAAATTDRTDELRAEIWNDAGRWLALALLPLLALGFRRGWIVAGWLVCLLPMHEAQASLWSDLWQRRDQQAARALEGGDASTAAALFEDPDWRGAAQYRAGDFAASAAAWAANDHPDAHYNRGNALAYAGELAAAIEAYERALALEPGHADAAYNLALVRQAAERAATEQEGDPADQSAAGGTQESSSAPTPGGAQPPGESGSGSAEAPTGASQASSSAEGTGQASATEAQSSADAQAASRAAQPGQSSTPSPSPQSGAEAQTAEERAAAAAALEEWASEQAAEQWLRRIPQDPGGLLRRKFQYQYQRLGIDQDGNYVWPGDEAAPW